MKLRLILLICTLLFLVVSGTACAEQKVSTPVPATASAAKSPQGPTVPPAATSPAKATQGPTIPPAATSPAKATQEPSVPISTAVFYNLPQAKITTKTGLYASPNRGDYVVPLEIPVNNDVFVMGKNATGSHLRVVWNKGVGWVPTSFTNYNADRQKLGTLPVFFREPPACVILLATQFSLNSVYKNDSNDKKRIAVVVDLFRSQYGDFPASSMALKVNDKVIDASRRQIVEHGQFSLKDVVFTVPGYIQKGDSIGYSLETKSSEPLAFSATIFSIPENCVWKID